MDDPARPARPLPEDEDEELRALARLLSHETGQGRMDEEPGESAAMAEAPGPPAFGDGLKGEGTPGATIPNGEGGAARDPAQASTEEAPAPRPPGSAERPTVAGHRRIPPSDLEWAPAPAAAGDDPGAATEDPAPLLAHRFEIVECLGEGPHGTVFRSRDHGRQGQEVALKILHRSRQRQGPDSTAQLQRAEDWIAACGSLVHPHLAPPEEAGLTEDGRAWIRSRLVRGETLRARLDRSGALPPRLAFEIARQVLLGLEAGHVQGLAHGRLDASNVLLEAGATADEGNPYGVAVRLTDFGLAAALDPDARARDSVQDVLGVAVLLADALTGVRHAADASDWAGCDASPGTSALGPTARRLLDRALARNPAARFGSARAMRRALENSPEWNPGHATTGHRRTVGLILLAGALTATVGVLLDPGALGGGSPEAERANAERANGTVLAASGSEAAEPVERESALDPAPIAPDSSTVDPGVAAPPGDEPNGSETGAANDTATNLLPGGAEAAQPPVASGEVTPAPETAVPLTTPSDMDAASNDGAAGEPSDPPTTEPLPSEPDPAEVLRTAQERIDALVREREALAARAATLESDRERERAEAQARVDELSDELERAREELAVLSDATNPTSPQGRRAARLAATLLDRWFEHLTAGRVPEARAVARTFAEDEDLQRSGIPGAAFLHGGLDALEALDELEGEGDPLAQLELLPLAWGAVARSEAAGLKLVAAAPTWALVQALPRGAEAALEPAPIEETPRTARIEDLVDALGRRFGELEADVDARLELHWDRMLADPLRDVDEVRLLAEHFDDGRLPAFLRDYARAAGENALAAGRLDPRALVRLESLTAWGDLLRTDAIDAPWSDGQAILELDLARRFALGGSALVEGRLPALPERLADPEPDGSWRERLLLRHRLLDPEVGLPGRVGARYLHYGRTVAGEVSWRWDVVRRDPEPPADADASRLIEQRFYDATGAFLMERTLRVLRIGYRLWEEDARRNLLLDLGDLDLELEARTWTPGAAPPPPARLFVAPEAPARFAHRMGQERTRCLVLAAGSARTWWAPGWGLVRHDDAARIARELVYAELPD